MKPVIGKMGGCLASEQFTGMTTIAEIASPVQSSASPPRCTAEIISHENSRNPFGRKPFGFLLLASLSAFNFWWYGREVVRYLTTTPFHSGSGVSDMSRLREYFASIFAGPNVILERG